MKNKLLIIVISTLLVLQLNIGISSADDPITYRGYVYYDSELINPDQVIAHVNGGTYYANVTTGIFGYYAVDFSAMMGDEISFDVDISGTIYESVRVDTIIKSTNTNFNLSIDSTMPPTNTAPDTPSDPNPSDGATDQDRNVDLGWSCVDPDGDDLTYDIYFGTTTSPSLMKEDHGSNSYNPGTLDYSETYYWQIKAIDEHGLSTMGPIWSFTIEDESTSGGGGGGSGGGGSDDDDDTPVNPGGGGGGSGDDDISGPGENLAPTAVATVDKNTGAPGTEFSFDASGSSDPEDTTLSYSWDFDDGSTGTGETITHTFTEVRTYQVMLTVEDAGGQTDTLDEAISIQIVTGNNPPTDLSITPNMLSTSVDTDLIFTLRATDADNDTIRYMIDWDDGADMTTERYESGASFDITHQYDTYGVYEITVTAEDIENATTQTTATVYVDVLVIDDEIKGWLIDTDSDGTYDVFRNMDTETETDVQNQNDTEYLIDADDDDTWDYIFETETNTLSIFDDKNDDDDGFNLALYVLAGLIILLLIVFGYLSYKNKQEQQKKEQQKKQEKKKKQSSKKKSGSSKSKSKTKKSK